MIGRLIVRDLRRRWWTAEESRRLAHGTVGRRFDFHSDLDVTALARYTPSANASYEFGFAHKTRSPNLYERYTWSTGGMAMFMVNMAGDGNGYVGNLDLQPEVAHTLSASFDWHDARQEQWGLRVTPYYTYVDDYINARRCGAGDTLASSGMML